MFSLFLQGQNHSTRLCHSCPASECGINSGRNPDAGRTGSGRAYEHVHRSGVGWTPAWSGSQNAKESVLGTLPTREILRVGSLSAGVPGSRLWEQWPRSLAMRCFCQRLFQNRMDRR
jgi:hypothetical protein